VISKSSPELKVPIGMMSHFTLLGGTETLLFFSPETIGFQPTHIYLKEGVSFQVK
jgi:hypothetical protein